MKHVETDLYSLAAKIYLHPLILIFATSIVLYVGELFGIVRIRRNNSLSTVLLILISIFVIWMFLIITSEFKNDNLLGNRIQSFISLIPKKILSSKLLSLFEIHIRDYCGMIVYENLGLFVGIGPKHRTVEK